LLLLALPTAAGAVCQLDTESDLSPLAAAVLTNIQTIPLPGILDNSPADPAKIFSACNRFVSLEIDGPDIFAAARDLIAQADHEVDLAFFDWQSDTEGSRLIGDGLISAQVGRSASDRLLVRFVIYDPPSQDAIPQLLQSYSDWIGRGLDPSRFDFQWATSPASYAWPAYHDKYIVVDARHLLITGANVQDKNDPTLHWHDSAYVLEGDVGLAALSAFEDAWSFEETKHWICDPVCEPDGTHPAPDHSWLPVFGAQAPGVVVDYCRRLRSGQLAKQFFHNPCTGRPPS
jgi:phosphatidylserine/phosphatidylglycerophosphate/cardiolipin synthase-like enzyme